MRNLFLFLAFSLLIFAGCQQDSGTLTGGGDAPTIISMQPSTVGKGDQNVNGTIRGSNFVGIVAVDMGAGIQILQTTLVNTTQIDIRFSVEATATGGPREIHVSTANGKATNSSVFSINDNKVPIASFTVSPETGGEETEFTFDASASSDPDGNITKYEWDFGDGKSATGKTVKHTFGTKGSYNVSLKVTDNQQGTGTLERKMEIVILLAPVARFTVTPHLGDPDTAFVFDASESTDKDGRITNYLWEFENGATDTGKTSRHKFAELGDYSVKLTVTDNHELANSTERGIEVRGKEPIPRYTVTPSSGDVNTTFHFDGSQSDDPDGHIVKYEWIFGDGKTDKGKTVDHKFSTDGNFSVELVVTDNHGLHQDSRKNLQVDKEITGTVECTDPAKNNGFIYGTVIGIEDGQWAIVQLPDGSTCANSFYHCGDMRRANPEGFYGIIDRMKNLGNARFSIHNSCPYRWPPAIGERVFLYWKSCGVNYCP